MVVGKKKKTKIKIISKKFHILKYIYIQILQTILWNTNFLQENVLIPYYSADQSLIMTDNPQHSDKNGEKKKNQQVYRKESVIATHFIRLLY